MDQIYIARNFLITIYKKNALWVLPALRFFLGLFIFNLINTLGYAKELNTLSVVLLMAVLTAILPVTWVYFLIFAFVTIHIFFASIELSIIIGMLFIVLLMLYIRISPSKSLLIIGLLLCFYFKVPFLIPLLAGLFLDITSVIPLYIASFIWEFVPQLKKFIEIMPAEEFNLLNSPDTFSNLYVLFINTVLSSRDWLVYALIFTLVVLIVYVISHMGFNYSRTVALCIGGALNLFGFTTVVVIAGLDINLVFIFLSTIVSLLIALVFNFFSVALDYERAERVEFQDDENYYYVKVIPKIK